MNKQKYDIFISYRRIGGYETAKHLYDLLTHDGYAVSFDIDTLRNGDFDLELLNRIDDCTDFILVLNQGAFDRTFETEKKDDWVRNELAYALEKNKNIIPVMLEGFTYFPKNLPEDIAAVAFKNGPKYDRYYFDSFYQKLKTDFLKSAPQVDKSRKWSVKTFVWIFGSIVVICFAAGLWFLLQNNKTEKITAKVETQTTETITQENINTDTEKSVTKQVVTEIKTELQNVKPAEQMVNSIPAKTENNEYKDDTIKFLADKQIVTVSGEDYKVPAGSYFVGKTSRGIIEMGKLYDRDGKVIKVFFIKK
jgi:hypothetical protein